MLTQQRLKELLHYDPETGLFKWIVSRRGVPKKGSVTGWYDKDGYHLITIDYKRYQAHRLAFLYMTGTFPTDQVDHINRIKDDNRFDNLRLVSNLENGHNKSIHKNNTSGVTGVDWYKQKKKWRARIRVNYKQIHLGLYGTIEEAKKARDNAKIKLHPSSPEARALSLWTEF